MSNEFICPICDKKIYGKLYSRGYFVVHKKCVVADICALQSELNELKTTRGKK